jgi:hypothetical protein
MLKDILPRQPSNSSATMEDRTGLSVGEQRFDQDKSAFDIALVDGAL